MKPFVGREEALVGVERHRHVDMAVGHLLAAALARVGIPDLDGFVHAGDDVTPAVAAESWRAVDRKEWAERLAGRGFPEADLTLLILPEQAGLGSNLWVLQAFGRQPHSRRRIGDFVP